MERNIKNAVENKPPPLARIFDLANGGGSNINIIKKKNQDIKVSVICESFYNVVKNLTTARFTYSLSSP